MGETIEIVVGGEGNTASLAGGSGGGGAFVFEVVGSALVPLVVAGGGGGASSSNYSQNVYPAALSDNGAPGTTTESGTAGGGASSSIGAGGIGGDGGDGGGVLTNGDGGGGGGGGGVSTAGGNGANGVVAKANGGVGGAADGGASSDGQTSGTYGGGGAGGGGMFYSLGGGGGGGGYSGGGGGEGGYSGLEGGGVGQSYAGEGGGGGGSYIDPDATNTVLIAGENTGNGAVTIALVACYVRGTRISTPAGEVPVEELRTGDAVVVASAGSPSPGAAEPIRWIGRRHIDCLRHPRPADVWPVRVEAGAFRDNVPERDLFLSPDHAVFLDGVLIPIRHLINDTTVAQEPRDKVEYWHIELARHGVLLAEGLPAESYLDTGNRHAFGNGPVEALYPAFGSTADNAWANNACAPLVESGPILEALRARLADRAALLGYGVSGVLDIPLDAAGCTSALVPPDVRTLRLVSASARIGRDRRLLGALVTGLRIAGASVAGDDRCLIRGFHEAECHDGKPVRWTDGAGIVSLPPASHARQIDIDVAAVSAVIAEKRVA
jgi:hypothetical protein